jgi:hypothetical protein
MHLSAKKFLNYCHKYFNIYYDGNVLDIGSYDVNGNNKEYFTNCDYIGCDVAEGINVDIVSKCHELEYEDKSFNVIISTEAFQYDYYYKKSLNRLVIHKYLFYYNILHHLHNIVHNFLTFLEHIS